MLPVVVAHPATTINLTLDNSCLQKRRVKPIAWMGEMSLGRRGPKPGVNTHEQQQRVRSDQVGNGRADEGLKFLAREAH